MTAPTDFLSRARRAIEEATPGLWDLPHLADPSIACDCGHVFVGPEEIFVATIHEAGKGENAPEHAVAVANAAKFVLVNNSFPELLDVYEAAKKLISAEVEYEESDDDKNDRELHARTLEARAHLRSRLARLETLGKEVAP